MRLNVGCGQYPVPGWVNIDLPPAIEHYRLPSDVVAGSVLDLPFPDDSFLQVYCGHVLEHVSHEDHPRACAELQRVMVDGAELCVVGPDIDRAVARNAWGAVSDIRNMDGPWPGAGHAWLPTEAEQVSLLADGGFVVRPLRVADVPTEWPVVSRVGWQFALICTLKV